MRAQTPNASMPLRCYYSASVVCSTAPGCTSCLYPSLRCNSTRCEDNKLEKQLKATTTTTTTTATTIHKWCPTQKQGTSEQQRVYQWLIATGSPQPSSWNLFREPWRRLTKYIRYAAIRGSTGRSSSQQTGNGWQRWEHGKNNPNLAWPVQVFASRGFRITTQNMLPTYCSSR